MCVYKTYMLIMFFPDLEKILIANYLRNIIKIVFREINGSYSKLG